MSRTSPPFQPRSLSHLRPLYSRIHEEFKTLKLSDLRIIATLGVGGFGRVELVMIAGDTKQSSYALKQMKKSQIVETRQQQHIMSGSDGVLTNWNTTGRVGRLHHMTH